MNQFTFESTYKHLDGCSWNNILPFKLFQLFVVKNVTSLHILLST